MKNIVRIAAISSTLMIGGLSFGQDKQTTPAPSTTTAPAKAAPGQPVPATTPRVDDGWRSLPLGMLIKQVGLTPEQTEKGKELNAKYTKLYQSLDAAIPLEDRKLKVKGLMDGREKELNAILTPEQQTKYKEMRTPSGAMQATPSEKPMPKASPTQGTPTATPEKKGEK